MWRQEFPPEYDVPKEIERLVKKGTLQDTSWGLDSSPSFSARLVKGWIRLWVEHPNPLYRLGSRYRFSVEITKNLAIQGRTLIEDDELKEVLPTLLASAETLDYRRYWRLLE